MQVFPAYEVAARRYTFSKQHHRATTPVNWPAFDTLHTSCTTAPLRCGHQRYGHSPRLQHYNHASISYTRTVSLSALTQTQPWLFTRHTTSSRARSSGFPRNCATEFTKWPSRMKLRALTSPKCALASHHLLSYDRVGECMRKATVSSRLHSRISGRKTSSSTYAKAVLPSSHSTNMIFCIQAESTSSSSGRTGVTLQRT